MTRAQLLDAQTQLEAANKDRHLTRFLKGVVTGIDTRIETVDRFSQTPPLTSRLFQRQLEGIGTDSCPEHQLDHGVRDAGCDHRKRALGPLHRHRIKRNRHLPLFTFDFSGPHPHRASAAQYLLVCVWSLGDGDWCGHSELRIDSQPQCCRVCNRYLKIHGPYKRISTANPGSPRRPSSRHPRTSDIGSQRLLLTRIAFRALEMLLWSIRLSRSRRHLRIAAPLEFF